MLLKRLESTFGEIGEQSSLGDAIMRAARNAAEDNMPDYLNDLIYASEDSSFEGSAKRILRAFFIKML